jgi:hypothetical protein
LAAAFAAFSCCLSAFSCFAVCSAFFGAFACLSACSAFFAFSCPAVPATVA